MDIYLLYNRQTPGANQVQELARRLKELRVEPELLDADSPRGIQIAEHYDILGRPAIIILRTDGSPVQIWQDAEQFPPPTEISYLVHQ